MRTTLLLATVAALSACDNQPAVRYKADHKPAVPRLEATITLPDNDGRVHVIVVPAGYMESTRCVVAIGQAGAPSVSCTPKDLDLTPRDE